MNPIAQMGLLSLIAEAFEHAEDATSHIVKKYVQNATETEITLVFQIELAKILERMSQENRVAAAFSADVMAAFQGEYINELEGFGHGLVAQVIWHSQKAESKTGADFGVVLARPVASVSEDYVAIDFATRGILAQAKKKAFGKKRWGSLTKKQKSSPVFSKLAAYGSLIGYRFQNAGVLGRFEWQSAEKQQLETVQDWLKKDNCPSPSTSREMLSLLWGDSIGTSDPTAIETDIALASERMLIIRIDWPGGSRPYGHVQVQREASRQKMMACQLEL